MTVEAAVLALVLALLLSMTAAGILAYRVHFRPAGKAL